MNVAPAVPNGNGFEAYSMAPQGQMPTPQYPSAGLVYADAANNGTGKNNGHSIHIGSDLKAAAESTASFHDGIDGHKGMRLAFKDCTFTVQVKNPETKQMEGKRILKGCTGIIKPGSLNAIMGSSGGGKTSLLDFLANRKNPANCAGEVLVDGRPRDPKSFVKRSGYVVQDDIVMGTLTVRENLLFSARLRLPQSVSDSEKKRRVDDVINELGLHKVADSKVGNEFIRGISGGERKRVNIGMELITSPSILFLDEPTTGLDTSTSYNVLKMLQRLAQAGRTIVLSIHQPRFKIFEMFDSVTIMSDGNIVYHGPGSRCVPYFAGFGYQCGEYNNPADFVLDVATGLEPRQNEQVEDLEAMPVEAKKARLAEIQDTLAKNYQASEYAAQALAMVERDRSHPSTSEPDLTGSQAGAMQQVMVVAHRTLINVIRNPATSIGQVVVNLIVAVIVGCIYWRLDRTEDPERAIRDRTGCLFFIMVNLMFSNASAIEIFLQERVQFIHERSSGYYSTWTYFVSKIFCDMIPVRVIPTIIFATACYLMTGLQWQADKYFNFIALCVLQSLVSSSLCFYMSSCFSVFAVANLSVTMVYVMSMIFSGLLVSVNEWPDGSRWLGYLSFCKYSYELAVENEFDGLTFDCSDGGACTGEEVLGPRYLNIETGEMGIKYLAMCCFTLGFLALGYIQLERITSYKG